MIINRLDWDSAFFGFPVGKLDITVDETLSELKSLYKSLKGYRLVYLFVDPGNAIINRFLMEQSELFRITNLTLRASMDKGIRTAAPGLCRELVSWDDDICGLAIQAGVCSRFNLDPNISNEQFKELYSIWIKNSISGEVADFTLGHFGSGQELQGLITAKLDIDSAVIGLFAVDHTARGQGVGKALFHAFKQKIVEDNIIDLWVTTQLENRAAISLYQKLGFVQVRGINIYHHWE